MSELSPAEQAAMEKVPLLVDGQLRDDTGRLREEAFKAGREYAEGQGQETSIERNPHLPPKPLDGKHSWSEGATDIGGNHRCTFCGAYRGSDEGERPCMGEYKESGKMRAWARDKWEKEKARAASRTGTPESSESVNESENKMSATVEKNMQRDQNSYFAVSRSLEGDTGRTFLTLYTAGDVPAGGGRKESAYWSLSQHQALELAIALISEVDKARKNEIEAEDD